MLLFYLVALTLCAAFLIGTGFALTASYRSGHKRQTHILHLLRLGLILSACSYALRLLAPPRPGYVSFLSLFFCLSGTVLIWIGFLEHWKMQRERRTTLSPSCDEEQEADSATASLTGLPLDLPPLTPSAGQAIQYAHMEARRRRRPCVDTEYLLLGLLRTPQSAGICILKSLGVGLEKVHGDLIGCMAPKRQDLAPPVLPPNSLEMTEHAHQVISLAAQEAYRFGQTSLGTEHLLLGLVLMGKGKAASVLFGEGVTVDNIRKAILQAKRPE